MTASATGITCINSRAFLKEVLNAPSRHTATSNCGNTLLSLGSSDSRNGSGAAFNSVLHAGRLYAAARDSFRDGDGQRARRDIFYGFKRQVSADAFAWPQARC